MRAYGWLVAVVVAAAVAALTAVAMLPPAGEVIDPVPAQATDYFTPQQIERGRDYRRPNLYISLAAFAAQIALLVWLVRRPPKRLGTTWWHGGLAGAAIAFALSVVTLPMTIILRIRARDVGLNTRSWGGWAWDWLLSVTINAVLMGIVALVLLALIRKLPRAWWAPGAVFVVVRRHGLGGPQPARPGPALQPLRAAAARAAARRGLRACA